jgi:hypothetical protein
VTALVLSAAANGYARVYGRHLASQRAYARRHGLAYRLVVPRRLLPPADAAWLKIALLARALRRHQWVLWIDADAEVSDRCPDFRTLAADGGLLYLADGHTGRLNSGVIAARASQEVVDWFELLLDRADEPVPAEDVAPFENGHVIHFARDLPFLRMLDQRWNNTADPERADYIRHYTGPLRAGRPRGRIVSVIARVAERSPAPRGQSTGDRARALAAALYA